MRSHFTPASVGKKTMRSHFISGAAIACAVTGATAMMPDIGSAQIAYDTATEPPMPAAGRPAKPPDTASEPGALMDNDPDAVDPGGQQGNEQCRAIGTAWTLFNLSTSDWSRPMPGGAITEAGGLQTGQTFETVIQNPTTRRILYLPRMGSFIPGTAPTTMPPVSTRRHSGFRYSTTTTVSGLGGNDSGGTFHPSLTGPTPPRRVRRLTSR